MVINVILKYLLRQLKDNFKHIPVGSTEERLMKQNLPHLVRFEERLFYSENTNMVTVG